MFLRYSMTLDVFCLVFYYVGLEIRKYCIRKQLNDFGWEGHADSVTKCNFKDRGVHCILSHIYYQDLHQCQLAPSFRIYSLEYWILMQE